jgi:hypothetical protein
MKRLLLALVLISTSASAEIEKRAVPCDATERICFYWWPKLPQAAGWHQDLDHSYMYSANALAPEGFTFANAETVIYAKALYKPRSPETKSLGQLVKDDKERFLKDVPGVKIAKAKAIKTADGKDLASFTFFPAGEGNWERVSYGEEGEFYLIFTVSSRTKNGLESALPAYEAMLRGYKEKL